MVMPIVEIQVPDEDVRDVRRAVGLDADDFDFERVWRDVVLEWIVDFAKQQFDTDGAHGASGKWKDYSGEPKYAAYKFAIVGHLDLLRWEKGGEYEMLYPSLTDPGSRWNHLRIDGNVFEFGSLVPHAAELGSATTGPLGEPSPPRKMLAIGSSHRRDLFRDISRNIRDHEGLPRGAPGRASGGKVAI